MRQEPYTIEIDYPGSGNKSEFVFDSFGRNAKIVETTGGSVTSIKQFVWSGNNRREQRDASGVITAQFNSQGEILSSVPYFWTQDHLNSVRSICDATGSPVGQLSFDAYGRSVNSFGQSADMQYAGYLSHARSGLYLTRTRSYSAALGRWTSREEQAYSYVNNDPIGTTDPTGQWGTQDFVNRYQNGGGDMTLNQVGLGTAFENSPEVKSEIAAFNQGLIEVAKDLAKSMCKDKKWKQNGQGCKTHHYPVFRQEDVDSTHVTNLLVLGHSTFFQEAKCDLTVNCKTRTFQLKCKNHFYIRDRFRDPTSLEHFTGIELEFGDRYRIDHDFYRDFSSSGGF